MRGQTRTSVTKDCHGEHRIASTHGNAEKSSRLVAALALLTRPVSSRLFEVLSACIEGVGQLIHLT